MTNKVWGGRFKKPLDPRVADFHASLSFDYVLYKQDILGSQVHAEMLEKQGLLTSKEAADIFNALEEIKHEIESNDHVLENRYEDIHMFVEHLLISKIGDTAKKLHTGRSRNDQVALDLRLYARDAAETIRSLLESVCSCLKALSQKHTNDYMPGYTHLQQAQPISLGMYLDAYHQMFKRDLSRLKDCFNRMNYSPLGAGALAGTRLPLDRKFVAEKLNFLGVIDNTLDAVSDRDYLIEFCGFASITMMHLSRLSEDLILWATQEFNFITLDDAFATGSSLMPNKKNPDVLELIRGKTGRVFGHLIALLTVMKALPLAYNKDMQEDKEGIFDTVQTLISCLSILTPFLKAITFNIEHMATSSKLGYLDATYYLEELVLSGIPFREAHHQIGEAVSKAMQHKKPLKNFIPSF